LEEVNEEFERVVLDEVERFKRAEEGDSNGWEAEAERLGRYWDRIRTYHFP
jgi:hypothetical protein